ncbi:MAG: formylglycine-generating enzyme family protein, partial [Treponema sp.]|nr:formylglycine-generating enzyme family protein [Treponema sp.]
MALVLVLAASCGDTPGSTGSSSPGDTQWSPGVAVIPMQPVASGTFTLGQNLGAGGATHNVTPLTPVTLTHGFQMGKYQVTREQWITVLEGNPNGIPVPHPNWSDAPPNQQEADAGFNVNRRPATHVSWYDAVVFANWLSIANGLTPVYEFQCESNNQWTTNPARWGTVPTLDSPSQLRDRWNSVRITSGNPTGYRLPTEAQWEFAAKGGVTADSYTFSGSDTVGDVAW